MYTKTVKSHFLCSFFILLLSACGGGGGGDNDTASAVFLTYEGLNTPASVGLRNSFSYILKLQDSTDVSPDQNLLTRPASDKEGVSKNRWKSLQRIMRKLPNLMQGSIQQAHRGSGITAAKKESLNESVPCDNGLIEIKGFLDHVSANSDTKANGQLTFTYLNCVIGQETLNGSMEISIADIDLSTSVLNSAAITFPSLSIRSTAGEEILSGSITILASQPNTQETTVNMVMVERRSEKQYKFENLVYFSEILFDFSIRARFSESIKGRIYDSDFGYVDVVTDSPLLYESLDAPHPYHGTLRFSGAEDAGFLVRIVSKEHFVLGLDLDGDQSYESNSTLTWPDLVMQQTIDLEDSDGDGMHNSFEADHGLDPMNPIDAQLDSDGDGILNLHEYIGGGPPDDPQSWPDHADLSISLEGNSFNTEYLTDENFNYQIQVSNVGPDSAYSVNVNTILPDGMTIVEASGHFSNFQRIPCEWSETRLNCYIDEIPAASQINIFASVTPPVLPTTITQIASVSTNTLDIFSQNNSTTLDTEFIQPYVTLDIDHLFATNRLRPILINQPFTLKYSVSNSGPRTAENITVTMQLPPDFTFLEGFSSGSSWQCGANEQTVKCTLPSLFFSSSLNINLSTSLQGPNSLRVSVGTDSFDRDQTDNVVDTQIIGAQSTTGIQSMMDAAQPGDTISIDPGYYYGELDFMEKDIILNSTQGAINTTILNDFSETVRIGPSGRLEDLTIALRGVNVIGNGSQIIGNIFDGFGQNGLLIGGNNSSPTIGRNLFHNNACINFVNSSSPLIHNNLFLNSVCTGLQYAPVHMILPAGNSPRVINNTFYGNKTAIYINRQVGSSSQIYRNNIIVNNETGLFVEFGDESINPIWEHNLVYGNTRNYLGITNQSGINGNLSIDPLFVNAGGLDFHLSIESPAIDSGSESLAPTDDFDGNSRPIDGNGDALPVTDIGAFEED